jgi:hypothetical protein
MSAETAVSIYNEETLKRLAGMVNAGDTPMETGPDTLKINYEEDSKYPRGVWVLGQKKDKEGKITEEGSVVSKIIILTTRCRWSYYDENTRTGVSTVMFEGGSQPRDKADFDRKVAALGGDPRFQTVVLGLAIVDGGFKEFVAYISGSSYKLFRDYLKEITTYKLPTGTTKVPPFVCVTELGESEKKKNGAVTYFIPSFKRGAEIPVAQFDMLAAKRESAYQWIEYANSRSLEKKGEGEGDSGGASFAPPSSTPPVYTPPKPAAPPTHSTGDRMPWEDPTSSVPTTKSAPEAPSAPEAEMLDSGGDDFDIEAAMRNIMGK